MPSTWRLIISAACRRAWFWLVVALGGNALVWLLIYGHQSSLSLAAPQSLYGFPISYDVSSDLFVVELLGIPFFGLALIASLAGWLITRSSRRSEQRGSIG